VPGANSAAEVRISCLIEAVRFVGFQAWTEDLYQALHRAVGAVNTTLASNSITLIADTGVTNAHQDHVGCPTVAEEGRLSRI